MTDIGGGHLAREAYATHRKQCQPLRHGLVANGRVRGTDHSRRRVKVCIRSAPRSRIREHMRTPSGGVRLSVELLRAYCAFRFGNTGTLNSFRSSWGFTITLSIVVSCGGVPLVVASTRTGNWRPPYAL